MINFKRANSFEINSFNPQYQSKLLDNISDCKNTTLFLTTKRLRCFFSFLFVMIRFSIDDGKTSI